MTTTAGESVTAEDRTDTEANEAAGEADRRALTTGRSRVAAADTTAESAVLAADPASVALADDATEAEASGGATDPETAESDIEAGSDDETAAAELDAEAEGELEDDAPDELEDSELDSAEDEFDDEAAEDDDLEAGEERDYAESDAAAEEQSAAETGGGRFRRNRKRRLPVRASDAAVEDETASEEDDFVPSRRGRGGFDPQADAVARAARYEHRQRAALGLLLSSLLLGAGGVVFTPMLWSACALSVLALIVYMVHLRRQVRIEAEIRRRRAARLSRNRVGDTDAEGRDRRREPLDPDSARALRRRAVVLDTDDEDPVFEQLEPFAAATARAVRNRAAGREVRRAAGE
ncbi:divisome protein SepX/GlpR [Nocardia stercoris]|nr:gephyrin-like molybdotransferase receptor GlpR [Nocardia stercoris]